MIEKINWVSVRDQLPDDNTTVLIFSPAFDEPCWLGYIEQDTWFQVDAKPLGDDAVTFWSHVPGGPMTQDINPR